MLPDGRSVVETWGTWRFRIMERGIRDGYTVARVERIEDYEEELDAAAESPSNPSSDGPQDPRNTGQDLSGSAARVTLRQGSSMPSAAASRSEVERAGDRLEAAVREEIGDVFAPVQPEAVSAASSPARLPSSSRSDANTGAISSSSSSVGRRNDRSTSSQPQVDSSAGAQSANGVSENPATRRVPTNAELMAKCHAFLEQTRQGTPWVVQHLHNHYVPMPSDPASFSFWMALVRPLLAHAPVQPADVGTASSDR